MFNPRIFFLFFTVLTAGQCLNNKICNQSIDATAVAIDITTDKNDGDKLVYIFSDDTYYKYNMKDHSIARVGKINETWPDIQNNISSSCSFEVDGEKYIIFIKKV